MACARPSQRTRGRSGVHDAAGALATLETKLGADTAPVETLVREGLRLLT